MEAHDLRIGAAMIQLPVGLEPVSFRVIGTGVHIDWRGGGWAVRRFSEVLNKSGEWEHEPNPSERDEAFRSRCRWPTPDAALKAFKKHVS